VKALIAIALSLVTFCGLAADAPGTDENKPEPIIGRWRWSVKNYLIDILADGTMSGSQEVGRGVWKAIPRTTVDRTYQLTWRGGEGVDIITLSDDGKTLTGKALDGFEFTATRVEASDTARDFDQLTAGHDRALANAAEAIDRLYQTALEALLPRATLANDPDAAVRIKQALEKVSAKANIAGAWNFVNHTDGVKSVVEFKANHAFRWNGKHVGMWNINDKQLIITHDNRGGHQDYYNLPIRDGKLDGTNTPRQKITITRKTE